MKECPDHSTLIDMEIASNWDAEGAMRHILACERCLTEIREAERLHVALDHKIAPTPGFADRVVAALPQAGGAADQGEHGHSWIHAAAIFSLATITALALLSAVAITSPGNDGVGPATVVFACLVGFAAIRMIPRSATGDAQR